MPKDSSQQPNMETMRHSMAHLLAMAVLRLYKNTKLGIGPAIENGFYHDFEFDEPIGQHDLLRIEEEMKKIAAEELPFSQIVVSREEAFDILNLQGQIYKTEILNSVDDQQISFYKTGNEFIDLCRGPHVEHTGQTGAFRLIGISGAHWKNDETRPQMQRIHGVGFATDTELESFFDEQRIKQEKDHRKLGQKMHLFTFHPNNGAGLPIWLPRGFALRKTIIDHVYKTNLKNQYQYIATPVIARKELSEKFDKDFDQIPNKYPDIEVENEFYSLKYTNIPNLTQIYSYKKRSYRDLPFRASEFCNMVRNEKSGELSGLTRVRNFVADTNIIISTREDLKTQLIEAIKINLKLYKDFGFENISVELAMQGFDSEKYPINPKEWFKTQDLILEATKSIGLHLLEAPGGAEKNGPGLNFVATDVYDRRWQLGKVYIDLKVAHDFKLTYTDAENKAQIPYIIYRSGIGSIERFFALLIENTGGIFPVWLSPVQVSVIPISEKFVGYAQEVYELLIDKEFSTIIYKSPDTMQHKIREAQMQMIPYMLVVGEKEANTHTVSVRPRSGQDLGMMKVAEFVNKLKDEIENKISF